MKREIPVVYITPLTGNISRLAEALDDPERRAGALRELMVLQDANTCLNLVTAAKTFGEGYKESALRVLQAGTGQAWFPCNRCGAPVGPPMDYGCCGGQHCPICGVKCAADTGCGHFIGWWCEWLGAIRLDVKWPDPIDGEIPAEVGFEDLVPNPAAVFGDAWELVDGYWDGDPDGLLVAYNAVCGHRGMECTLTGLLLSHVCERFGLLRYEFSPAGSSAATGVTDSYFAVDDEAARTASGEMARIMVLIERGLRWIARGNS